MAQEREKIIQIVINSKDAIIALTNYGNILTKPIASGAQWTQIEKPISVNYKAKMDLKSKE